MHQRLGLLGENISYSLSPEIHKKSAEILGLDISYDLFDYPDTSVESFLTKFLATGGTGFNVTTPHKTLIGKLLNSKSNAVNTVYRNSDSWKTASTDAEGFSNSLSILGHTIEDYSSIFILGSGGVVSSLVEKFCVLKNPPQIKIFRRNRTRDNALKIISKDLDQNIFDFEPILLKSELKKNDSKKTLLVQATNAPIHGNPLTEFIEAVCGFEGTFVDLVYGTPSSLLSTLKKKGVDCQDGLPMLIEQARLSQELWWSQSAPYSELFQHIQQKLQNP